MTGGIITDRRTIVVFGAGPGLGYHIAREFGLHGFRTVLVSRNGDRLRDLSEKLSSEGIESHYVTADCSDPSSIKTAVDWISSEWGIDVVSYNAVYRGKGDIMDIAPEELTERYRTDVAGALCAVQLSVPHMKDGAVLLTGGGYGLDPSPEAISISLHKAALIALAKALDKELSPKGIFTGIINIKGRIGVDEGYSPERVASRFYRMYEERKDREITF